MGDRKLSADYEAQQEEFRKLQGGNPEDDDPPTMDVPKEPEVNPELYRDVESMLFRGFLTQYAEINEIPFVFKTLNHHEHEMIKLMGGYDEKGVPTAKFWSVFLAYSVFMLDGVNVLPERAQWIPKFSKEFNDFQTPVKLKIIRYLSEVNRRAKRAITLTECYALEKYSRYRWFQVAGMDIMSPSLTGIAGTEALGLNWAQLTWRAINRIDDQKDALEQQWEHAKFIGSCSAGKAIQKVYNRDTERRKKEREDQISRKESLLRHVVLGEPMQEAILRKDGVVWVTAQSTEDLVRQLNQDLKGEKDWHDIVVDRHEARVRNAQEEQEQQALDMAKQREKEFEGKTLIGGTINMEGMTQAEVRDLMIRRQQITAQASKNRPQLPPNVDYQEMDTHVETTDRDPTGALPVPTRTSPVVTPFGRK